MAAISNGRIVLASGLTSLVKAAVANDTDGLRTAIGQYFGNTRDILQNSDGTWPTVTRRDWLSYRWVARYDATKTPTRAVGALPQDQYVGYADAFLPADLP